MTNYLPISWKATIVTCPHCKSILHLVGESIVNRRCAIQDVFFKIKQHLTEDCIMKSEDRKVKKTDVDIQKKSRHVQNLSLMTEHDTDKILV